METIAVTVGVGSQGILLVFSFFAARHAKRNNRRWRGISIRDYSAPRAIDGEAGGAVLRRYEGPHK
jgi:hypothetical protein